MIFLEVLGHGERESLDTCQLGGSLGSGSISWLVTGFAFQVILFLEGLT